MKRITKKQYEAIPADYRSVWKTEGEWYGKRTAFAACLGFDGLGTRLMIEGVHFEIAA
jgi:hypothetical protein